MEKLLSLLPIIIPLLVGIFGAGGAGTYYFKRRSQAPLDVASAKKVEAEASMVVVEGWQRLAETLQKQCATLTNRVDALEKRSRLQEESQLEERLEYKRKINSLEIELASVISSSNYKDKQIDEQRGLITILQQKVTYLESELKKYSIETI